MATATESLLLEFDFLQSNCFSGVFPDVSGKNLITNLNTNNNSITCLRGNGVQTDKSHVSAPALVSTTDASQLFISNQLSLEFWLRLNVSSTISTITDIFTMGNLAYSATSPSCQFNIKLSQFPSADLLNPSSLFVHICGGNGIEYPILLVNTGNSDTIIHVVLTVGTDTSNAVTTTMYINGILSQQSHNSWYSAQSSNSPLRVSSSAYLQLFGSSSNPAFWPGQLYLFRMYNRILSTSEISMNFNAGIPNSLPTVVGGMYTVKENGESGDHYSTPAFYLSQVPASELSPLTLDAFDLDEQPYCALSCTRRTITSWMYVKIVDFPVQGVLYTSNGTLLSALNPWVTKASQTESFVVRYRPPWRLVSPSLDITLDSFSYIAIDGSTSFASPSSGIVSIVVTRVLQPPQTQSINLSLVANVLKLIPIVATCDATSNATISEVMVTQMPSNGQLYQVYSNGSMSNSLVMTSTSLWSKNVAYIYSGTTAYQGQDGIVGADSFVYFVRDTYGHASVPASASLTVLTPIIVVSNSVSVLAPQEVPTALTLFGKDASLQRTINVVIESSPLHGRLVDGSANITGGSTLAQSQSPADYVTLKGSNVSYISNSLFFNTPQVNWKGNALPLTYENFSYHFRASDGSRSVSSMYQIKVKNVNDPTAIAFTQPTTPLQLYAFSANPPNSTSSISSSLTLQGFSVTDPDLNVDPIRVSITTISSSARLTLNRNAMSALDFSSAQYCFSLMRWQCKGNGYSSSSLTFIAQPSDAEAAINGLTYINTQPNLQDVITITLYDGEGGFCLDNTQLGPGSIRSGCFVSTVSINVAVLGFSNVITDRASSSSFLSIGYVIYAIIGVLAVIALLVGRCVYYRCNRKEEGETANEGRASKLGIRTRLINYFKRRVLGEEDPVTTSRARPIERSRYDRTPRGNGTESPERLHRSRERPQSELIEAPTRAYAPIPYEVAEDAGRPLPRPHASQAQERHSHERPLPPQLELQERIRRMEATMADAKSKLQRLHTFAESTSPKSQERMRPSQTAASQTAAAKALRLTMNESTTPTKAPESPRKSPLSTKELSTRVVEQLAATAEPLLAQPAMAEVIAVQPMRPRQAGRREIKPFAADNNSRKPNQAPQGSPQKSRNYDSNLAHFEAMGQERRHAAMRDTTTVRSLSSSPLNVRVPTVIATPLDSPRSESSRTPTHRSTLSSAMSECSLEIPAKPRSPRSAVGKTQKFLKIVL